MPDHIDGNPDTLAAFSSPEQQSAPTVLPEDSTPPDAFDPEPPLHAHSVIRLIQCPRCSLPLGSPLRLPCGNTLCRSCLPPLRKRVGVTFPMDEGRGEVFSCYWCDGEEHSMGDCGTDVLVSKLVDVFEEVLRDSSSQDVSEGEGITVRWKRAGETESVEEPDVETAIIKGGRLVGTYNLAKEGRLNYDVKEVTYHDGAMPSEEEARKHDEREDKILGKLKELTRNELDCQLCYALILDPLTTPCGHTFCRKCIARILDHSNLCPICRRKLGMPPAVWSIPVNKMVSSLLQTFFADQVAARRDASTRDEIGLDDEKTLPLFVCTLSFPTMPTFLHIFEPRYRLMMRRVMENGERKFGMVTFNHNGQTQGQLGRTQFMQYGTLLIIDRFELLPDGRSLVSAVGVSRFKILDWGVLDGYYVAKTERVDDISLADEENLESRETAAPINTSTFSSGPEENNSSAAVPLDSLSTQRLLQLGLDFVERRRREAAPWLHQRVLMAYGDVPTDPSRFPWWLASVLPISEEERYALLPTTSVRERLKITSRWVRKLETMDRSTNTSICAVL
ncbi:hypothetical protein VTN02DRAFT_19 [Thermoascus thermophilus]